MKTARLKLSQILIPDPESRVREKKSDETIKSYAERMADGVQFPPLVVFYDGAHHHLADGFHRLKASELNAIHDVECEVREGDANDALWFAMGANRAHGLPMTSGDKRKAIRLALQTFKEKGQAEIAKQVGCSQGWVAQVKAKLISDNKLKLPDARKGKDDKVRPTTYKKGPPSKEALLIARLEKRRAELVVESGLSSRNFNQTIATKEHQQLPIFIEARYIDERIQKLKRLITEAAASAKTKKPELNKDETEFAIPESLLPLWKMRDAMRDHLRLAGDNLSAYKRAQEESNPLYAELKLNNIMSDLDAMRAQLKMAIPFAVCVCLGTQQKCGWCRGRGLVSKHTWERIPTEQKDERNEVTI